jgi:hypothetical protein
MLSTIISLIGISLVLLVYIIWLLYFKEKYCKEYNISFNYSYNKIKVPLIKFQWQGELYYFLLDTGSNVNIIDSKFFEQHKTNMKVTSDKSEILSLGNGYFPTEKVHLDLNYSKVSFPYTMFVVSDLSASFNEIERMIKQPVIGIIGSPFLREHGFKIDFTALAVWIKV